MGSVLVLADRGQRQPADHENHEGQGHHGEQVVEAAWVQRFLGQRGRLDDDHGLELAGRVHPGVLEGQQRGLVRLVGKHGSGQQLLELQGQRRQLGAVDAGAGGAQALGFELGAGGGQLRAQRPPASRSAKRKILVFS